MAPMVCALYGLRPTAFTVDGLYGPRPAASVAYGLRHTASVAYSLRLLWPTAYGLYGLQPTASMAYSASILVALSMLLLQCMMCMLMPQLHYTEHAWVAALDPHAALLGLLVDY